MPKQVADHVSLTHEKNSIRLALASTHQLVAPDCVTAAASRRVVEKLNRNNRRLNLREKKALEHRLSYVMQQQLFLDKHACEF